MGIAECAIRFRDLPASTIELYLEKANRLLEEGDEKLWSCFESFGQARDICRMIKADYVNPFYDSRLRAFTYYFTQVYQALTD